MSGRLGGRGQEEDGVRRGVGWSRDSGRWDGTSGRESDAVAQPASPPMHGPVGSGHATARSGR
eukprot:2326706-Prymnesium_polylepis.2